MRVGSATFLVSAVKWDIFGSLTFRGIAPASADVCAGIGLRWLRALRVRMSVPEPDWFWFLRVERGEAGGRLHLHVLLRVRPVFRSLFLVRQGHLCVAHRLWARGMTTFRAVEGWSDPAYSYSLKDDSCGADSYESGKSARARYWVASPALLARAGLQQSAGDPMAGLSASKHTLAMSTVSLRDC